MVKNRLPHTGKGELLTIMHQNLLEKCEALGSAALALREKPEALMHEKAELERHLQDLLHQNEERQRKASMSHASEKERAMHRELDAARSEVDRKDSELRRMRIALQASHDELQQVSAQRAELRRELDAERAELHKLRQERRTTTLPQRVVSDAASHASPRQLEHPELTSPRQVQRQQVRAASAAMRRSAGPSDVGGGARPFSARPASHAAAASIASHGAVGGVVLHAPLTPRRPISAGPTPRRTPGGFATPSTLHSHAFGADLGAQADASTQTPRQDALAALEQQNRELLRANARLQTALLAAALDPDGSSEVQGLLAAVDRGLAKRAGTKKQPISSIVDHSSRARASSPAEKSWPFPRSNLPKGYKLPAGYAHATPDEAWQQPSPAQPAPMM